MLEAQVQSLGREDSLKEEMTTYSSITCLGNPMERGAWWARVHGVAKSQTRLRDSTTALSPPRSLSFPSRPCRPRLQQELEPQEGTSPWAALVPLGFAELWHEPSKVYAQPACWLFLKTRSWMSCVLNFRAQEEMGQAGRICTTAQKRCGLTPTRTLQGLWGNLTWM